MNVYSILYGDNTNYDSVIHIVGMNTKKEIVKSIFSPIREIEQKIERMTIKKDCNYYITANSFIPFASRNNEGVFGLDNIVIDFDIHTIKNKFARESIIDEFIWRFKRDLLSFIPIPNVIHKTGRGVQIWWSIQKASKDIKFVYVKIVEMLNNIFVEWLSEYPELGAIIDIDTSASLNIAGLFRMFDTYNTATKTKTEFEVLHLNKIDINKFRETLENTDTMQLIIEAKKKKAEFYANRDHKKSKKTVYKESGYITLNKKRMALIEYLVKERDNHIGYRNTMLYLYYNATKQVLSVEEAKIKTAELNNKFNELLSKFDNVYKSKKVYNFKNTTVYEMLALTNKELADFNKLYRNSCRNATRDAIAAQNKKIRQEKKQQAENLLKTTSKTIKEIVDEVELSESQIAKLSAEINRGKKKNKPWEEIGLSIATYYRKKKNEQL